MLFTLALATLVRHRGRTLMATLGVAVSAAMLLDMVMLASGMRESFRSLLVSRGFQIRLAPRGTLPFDTEATIADAAAVARALRANPTVERVSPVLGGQLHVETHVARDRTVLSTVALGTVDTLQADYEVTAGSPPRLPDELVANDAFLRASGARIGDTLNAAAGFDPQLRAFTGERRLRISGRAHFFYLAADERAVALPLATLQRMQGAAHADHVSLFMVRAHPGTNVEQLRRWIERTIPSVSAISTETAVQQVQQRLSYFRQLAFILGAVSLVVGFLLVTTLVTVSVNERLGEIAVMRAIGVARARVVLLIVLESTALMLGGAVLGLGLGLLTARYLNSILAAFPGLPAAIDFFLFQPRDVWTALGLLSACGIAAAVYPSWRGASLPIAQTLREEVVG